MLYRAAIFGVVPAVYESVLASRLARRRSYFLTLRHDCSCCHSETSTFDISDAQLSTNFSKLAWEVNMWEQTRYSLHLTFEDGTDTSVNASLFLVTSRKSEDLTNLIYEYLRMKQLNVSAILQRLINPGLVDIFMDVICVSGDVLLTQIKQW